MDPIFCSMYSHSMAKLVFLFICEKLIFFKNLESPLIFVLVFKIKKIRKKNPKCDSKRKNISVKNRVRDRGSGYLSERYNKDRSTSLSS